MQAKIVAKRAISPPATPVIRLERPHEGVALVTIDRPAARNAISRQLRDEMEQIIVTTESDPSIRVVVLTGSGNQAFCAGADLREVAEGNIGGLISESGGLAGFTHQARRKPWIAAVNGAALAGGCEIALACEIIVAAEHAIFGLPEPKRGLIAACGGIYRLAQAIPRKLANELVLTGRSMSAAEALGIGLINRVTTIDCLLEEAFNIADGICACAPSAIEESLHILGQSETLIEVELWRLSKERLEAIGRTPDFAEGVRAFLEKRGPVWESPARR